MHPSTITPMIIALVAATLAGCTSSPDGAPSALPTPTTTTAPTATTGPVTTAAPVSPAATRAEASPHTTGAVSPPSQPSPRQLLLTGRGLGGVPVGATLEEFAEALGRSPAPMSAMDRSVFADHRCVIRQLAGLLGVGFMAIGDDPEGKVRLISVHGSGVRTDRGIRLGSRLEEVRAAYGPGLDEPFDHYPIGGDAVLVRAGAGTGLYLAFIGDDRDRVMEFRLGYKPEVLYPEGCV